MSTSHFGPELSVATEAAIQAAAAIMAVYDTAAVHFKGDGSPVTEADLSADRVIRELIGNAFPNDAILTEEGVDDRERLLAHRCWIVDPIDGTAAFVAHEDDFDVYLALVIDGRPVVAVTIQPVTNLLITAVDGHGAWIGTAGTTMTPLRIAPAGPAPRIGTRRWLGAPSNLPLLREAAQLLGPAATVVVPETGLNVRSLIGTERIVDVIAGIAVGGESLDAHEWDIAAVDLITREAGGACSDLDGAPLRYNQPRTAIDNVLLSSDHDTHAAALRAISSRL